MRFLLPALLGLASLVAIADEPPPPAACPAMNATNIYIASTCLIPGSRCQTGASQQFLAAAFQYDFNCAPHTFLWNFGDGSPAIAGQAVSHSYAAAGNYTVLLTVTNAAQTYSTAAAIVIAGTGCPSMTTSNVALTSDCSSACPAGVPLTFSVAGTGYDFSCGTHAFTWNFGDGSSLLTAQTVSHTYAAPGAYPVTVAITNASQTLPIAKNITVVAAARGTTRVNLLGDAGRFGSPAALSQWTQHGTGLVTWSADSAGDSGSGSAELTATSTATYISRVVPVVPSRSYIAQALLRNPGSGSCNGRISIWFLAAPDGPVIGGREGYSLITSTQWDPFQSISGELIFSPTAAKYAEIRLSGETPGCTVHFSDAGFYEITPEIKSFTTSASDVAPGTPVTLSWRIENATGINAPGGSHLWYNDPGSAVVYPQTTTTYTLNASVDRVDGFGSLPPDVWKLILPHCLANLSGRDSSSVTVHVTPTGDCPNLRGTGFGLDLVGARAAGQAVTFEVHPGSRDSGFCSRDTLLWDFGDGSSGLGAKVIHTYAAAGTYQVLLRITDSADPTFSAFVGSTLQIQSGAVGVLSLSSTSIRAGDAATITWYASVAAEVHTAPYGYFSDRSLPIGPMIASGESGSLQVSPSDSTTYVLTGPGSTPVLDVVAVYVNSSTPPSIQFSATPASIRKGDPVVLSWQISGDDCGTPFIDNGVGPTAYFDGLSDKGSTVIYPSETTTYTLTAEGSGGRASKAVTVTVDSVLAASIRHLAGVALTSGATNGPVSTALFNHPAAAGIDAQGNVYVVDAGNHAIRRIRSDGTVETYAGQLGVRGRANGYRTQATFDFTNFSGGFLVSSDGAITVWDASGRRDVSVAGEVTGNNCTSASCGRFIIVTGIVRGPSGIEYWSDSNKHVIWQRPASSPDASILAGTSGEPGFADGRASQARFNTPRSLTIDAEGSLFVSDSGNQAIRKVTADGRVTTYAGKAPDGSTVASSSGDLSPGISALVAGAGGVLYVVDPVTNSIMKILPDGRIQTLVGNGSAGSADGSGSNGTMNDPSGITRDRNGELVTTDRGNHEVRTISDPVPPPCPLPDPTNTTIEYENATAACGPAGNECTTNDALYFSLRGAGFAFSCAAHSFVWDFGDGTRTISSASSQKHAYALPGAYAVRVTISRGDSTTTVTRTLTIVTPHGRRRATRH